MKKSSPSSEQFLVPPLRVKNLTIIPLYQFIPCFKPFKKMEDYFGNVPDIVMDKSLEKLPIRMAAQTSVVSKQWRRAWLSLGSLIFDCPGFWRDSDSRKCSEIISNILFYHNGPVHDFRLVVPECDDRINHNSWISFLSKNGARKIEMGNFFTIMNITSNIFRCSELVHLTLNGFMLSHPPTDFSGFPNLKHLELQSILFRKQNFVGSLIEHCRKLETLKLVNWSGMDHVVIDAPSLQTLVLVGYFESLAFRNIRSLESISMRLDRMPENVVTVETVDAVNLLASSCQLQSIEFNGLLCKFLAAGGVIRSTSVTFNHLDNLCLSNLNLSDFHIYRYLLSMIECCPFIKTLDISLFQGESVGQHVLDLDFNHKYKLNHLREVNINGIAGSSAELKLVEYVLAISASLENMFFKYGYHCGTQSKLKMSVALMRFPRASPKSSLVCLEI